MLRNKPRPRLACDSPTNSLTKQEWRRLRAQLLVVPRLRCHLTASREFRRFNVFGAFCSWTFPTTGNELSNSQRELFYVSTHPAVTHPMPRNHQKKLNQSSSMPSRQQKASKHRSIETSKHRSIEASKHRSIEASKHRSIEASKHRSIEASIRTQCRRDEDDRTVHTTHIAQRTTHNRAHRSIKPSKHRSIEASKHRTLLSATKESTPSTLRPTDRPTERQSTTVTPTPTPDVLE